MLMKPEISAGLMGLLARKQRLYFTLLYYLSTTKVEKKEGLPRKDSLKLKFSGEFGHLYERTICLLGV